jgi:hypothetical protein
MQHEVAVSRSRQLQQQIKWQLYSTATVLLCTVDSVSRMLGDIEEAAKQAEHHGAAAGWTTDEGILQPIELSYGCNGLS